MYNEHESTLILWRTDNLKDQFVPLNSIPYDFRIPESLSVTHDGKDLPAVHVYDTRSASWSKQLVRPNPRTAEGCVDGHCTPSLAPELGTRQQPVSWLDPSGTPMLLGGRVCKRTAGPNGCSVGDRTSAYYAATCHAFGVALDGCNCPGTVATIGQDTATVTWDDGDPNLRVVALSDIKCFDPADGGAALNAHTDSENQRRAQAAAAGQAVSQPRAAAAAAAAACAEFEFLDDIWGLVALSAGTVTWERFAAGWTDPVKFISTGSQVWPRGREGSAVWTSQTTVHSRPGASSRQTVEIWMFGGAARACDWEVLPVRCRLVPTAVCPTARSSYTE